MLATEAAARRPKCTADGEEIAQRLLTEFSTENRAVKLTGRACREHLDCLIAKYVEKDKKALKNLVQKQFIICFQKQDSPRRNNIYLVNRSGTEEKYGQLSQLLEDIYNFRKDSTAMQKKEREQKAEGERR